MIRVILYLVLYVIGISVTIAQVKSEGILLNNNDVELPGTLTYTQTNVPLIIWVHGSGNIDRNGNQTPMIKANYIKQFRDSINKHNIAFYSYDKRTATKKNIPILKNGVHINDYVTDVKKAIYHFKNDKRFSKIILVGHSQGSLVAMLASEKVDKLISIAGPGMSADKTIIKQIQEKAPFLDSITIAHFKELATTGKIENVNPMLISIFRKENQSFLSSWIEYSPEKEIQKVKVPILIVNGDSDLQVKETDARDLHKANPNAEIKIIKNMNHVLKEVNSNIENQTSYLKPDYPLSSELIKTIVKFIKK
ncbi:alpha/beta hydrolase [uncultured Polaribacter sp.]|uniref:alpha/beta hydrolase n=1 Tax=uncultured Polaribacter sp. TaxID=174711 RepID=UPI00259B10A8|nr:alpha/beta hydrolase [uncultured Polaribacter sp.]